MRALQHGLPFLPFFFPFRSGTRESFQNGNGMGVKGKVVYKLYSEMERERRLRRFKGIGSYKYPSSSATISVCACAVPA